MLSSPSGTRSVWSHTAMLLLGLTLAVGFYEGRQLVRNTAKAFEGADRVSAAAGRQERRAQRTEAETEPPASLLEDIGADSPETVPVARKGRKARREGGERRRRRHERLQRFSPTSLHARSFGGQVMRGDQTPITDVPLSIAPGMGAPILAREPGSVRFPRPQDGLGALGEGGLGEQEFPAVDTGFGEE